MAEEAKPYLNARLRNPLESVPQNKKLDKPEKVDWFGGACAIVAVVVAAVELVVLLLDKAGYPNI